MIQRCTSRSSLSLLSADAPFHLIVAGVGEIFLGVADFLRQRRSVEILERDRLIGEDRQPAGVTSAKPPRTKNFCTAPESSFTSTSPGFSVLMSGAWRASTVK